MDILDILDIYLAFKHGVSSELSELSEDIKSEHIFIKANPKSPLHEDHIISSTCQPFHSFVTMVHAASYCSSFLILILTISTARSFNIHSPLILQRSSKVSSNMVSDSQASTTPVSDSMLDEVLSVAIESSRKAGDIILGNAGGAEVTERKANSRDLLTLIDPLCEKTIRETVLATFPTHDFLGEEDVAPGKDASSAALAAKLDKDGSDCDWLWIVDPIDGTTNFVHGMPLCMPSVAVAYKGEVVVGVIYDCHRDELFTAIKGKGAFLNGDKITVGKQETIGDAIVAMGSPPGVESMEMSIKGVTALMPKVRTIRMLGSAAIMLAWVANGRLTCYWEYDLSSWDIAAGALLVCEAGGRFTDLEGNDFLLRNRKIVASNGLVHDGILETLKEADIV